MAVLRALCECGAGDADEGLDRFSRDRRGDVFVAVDF
jgi:hypothetical protein